MANSYWEQRAGQSKNKVIKVGENGINDLKRVLALNLKDVEKKIREFYEKYAEDGYSEQLSFKELEKYKLELKKAIKKNPKDKTLKRIFAKDAPLYKIERLRALETDLQIILAEATTGQEKGIYKTLNDVGKVSQAVTAKMLYDNTRIVFDTIAKDKMQKLLSSDWSGANWSDRLWKDREIVGAKVQEILEKGVPQGTSLQKMTRELKQATQQSYNNCFRLIRTETAYLDGQVLLESFKQAQKELGYQSYIYNAHLDNRTSKICKELNGKKFKIDDAVVGENFIPMHPNCRSTCVLDENSIIDPDEEKEEKEKQLAKIEKDIEQSNSSKAKEYKDFKDFNNTGRDLAQFVRNNNKSLSTKEQVELMRKSFDKGTLNSYINIGKLNKEAQELLKANTQEVKFSIDNLIKNRIKHPEIRISDYKKIDEILKNPDQINISKKDPNRLEIIKTIKGKEYFLAIKSTKDKKECFTLSLRDNKHGKK